VRRIAALLLVIVGFGACAAPDDRPWRSGGGGPGGGSSGNGPDARVIDAGGAIDGAPATLHGVVCTATDLRAPIACTTSPGAGLPVSDLVSGASTTTASDSSFALAIGATADLDVETGGDTAIVPSVASVVPSATAIVVPVVDKTYLDNLEADLSAVVPDGSGIVALYVTDATGAGAPGWSAVPPPGIAAGPYYDDATKVGWQSGATTGAIGGVLMFGVPAGTISIGIAKGATSANVTGVLVVGGHVTFAHTIVTP
jgi:hypothetical protein